MVASETSIEKLNLEVVGSSPTQDMFFFFLSLLVVVPLSNVVLILNFYYFNI